ncbi:MAG: ribokinase [Planctomycetota bacterium]
MDRERPKIAVVGSINMDLVVRCERIPQPGETLHASGFAEVAGGKGANQAVAAARAGGEVTMIGCVGHDAFADRLVAGLRDAGVNTDGVKPTECPSGIALITVSDCGENQILVVAGANAAVSPQYVQQHAEQIAAAEVLLLQLEIPLPGVLKAIEIAKAAGTRVILDPAPASTELPEELWDVDLLCPNSSEAQIIAAGHTDPPLALIPLAAELQRRGPNAIAITIGKSGTMLFENDRGNLVPAFETHVRDTTAAGDAFAGALAVAWAGGSSLADAVRVGNAAGSLSAAKDGAQPSLPMKSEIEVKLQENHS